MSAHRSFAVLPRGCWSSVCAPCFTRLRRPLCCGFFHAQRLRHHTGTGLVDRSQALASVARRRRYIIACRAPLYTASTSFPWSSPNHLAGGVSLVPCAAHACGRHPRSLSIFSPYSRFVVLLVTYVIMLRSLSHAPLLDTAGVDRHPRERPYERPPKQLLRQPR